MNEDKKKLESLSKIMKTDSPSVRAGDKLKARETALKLLKDKGYSDDQLKSVKKKMNSLIDEQRQIRLKKLSGAAKEMIGDANRVVKSSGKKVRSMIPGLGLGLAAMNILNVPSAEASEVAIQEAQQAATDIIPGGVDTLGPQEGSTESIVEDPSATPEMRRKALELLRKRSGIK